MLRARSPRPPIVIYQMGKVGSRSVYDALSQTELAGAVFHVHWLTAEGIAATDARYQAAGTNYRPPHLLVSHALFQRRRRRPHEQWRIISLVRDPIARSLSEFFELMWVMNPQLIRADGSIEVEHALQMMTQRFDEFDPATDRANTWFDQELKRAFGIDVFASPFDSDHGAAHYESSRAKVLLIRLEDLSRHTSTLADFVGVEQLTIAKANSGMDKEHAAGYRKVRERFRLDPERCRQIYDTPYARQFYSDNERDALMQRWSSPPGVQIPLGDPT